MKSVKCQECKHLMQESQNTGIRVVIGIAGYREQNVSHIEELHRLREMSYQ